MEGASEIIRFADWENPIEENNIKMQVRKTRTFNSSCVKLLFDNQFKFIKKNIAGKITEIILLIPKTLLPKFVNLILYWQVF